RSTHGGTRTLAVALLSPDIDSALSRFKRIALRGPAELRRDSAAKNGPARGELCREKRKYRRSSGFPPGPGFRLVLRVLQLLSGRVCADARGIVFQAQRRTARPRGRAPSSRRVQTGSRPADIDGRRATTVGWGRRGGHALWCCLCVRAGCRITDM